MNVPSLSWTFAPGLLPEDNQFVARWWDYGRPRKEQELRISYVALEEGLSGDAARPYIIWQVEVVPDEYLTHFVIPNIALGDVTETSAFSLRGALNAAEKYVYLHNRQSRAEGRRIPHFLARVIGVHLLQNWCLHKRLHSYYDVPGLRDVERMLQPFLLRNTLVGGIEPFPPER